MKSFNRGSVKDTLGLAFSSKAKFKVYEKIFNKMAWKGLIVYENHSYTHLLLDFYSKMRAP